MKGGNLKKISALLLSLLLVFSACSTKEQYGNDIKENEDKQEIISEIIDDNSERINSEQTEISDNTGSATQEPKVKIEKAQKSEQEKTENKDGTAGPNSTASNNPEQKPVQPSDSKQDVITGATQTQDAPIETEQNIVRMSIKGDESIILADTDIEFKTGDTVLSALIKITREKKIHMDFSGSKESAYIKGIDNLYEFDKGPNSGWKYTVNGVYPAYSAGDYELEKGDIIKWIYVK